MRLGVTVNNFEGEVLDVGLYGLVGPVATNQSLGIEDGVLGVSGQLVLGSISNKPDKSFNKSAKYLNMTIIKIEKCIYKK